METMNNGREFTYKVGKTTESIINQVAALSVWMTETMDLLNDLDMFQGDLGKSPFDEEDSLLSKYYELRSRLALYVGMSIANQLDAQRLADMETLSEVTI